MDVVRRYDIDGVHFDDYFYPYKEISSSGTELDFPDEASWQKFGVGRKLGRDDWRRENVNAFIERVYSSIKGVKPWVKFGVSPFGIWRPGNPAPIKGFDRLRKTVCRLAQVAEQRLGGLLRAAALLGDRFSRAKLSRLVEMVDATESQRPPYLSRDGRH